MPSSSNPASRRSGRGALLFAGILAGLILGVLFTAAIGLAWAWLHRDQTPALTVDGLAAARRLWHDRHVTDYDLEVQLAGQREGVILTKVRDDMIVEHTNSGRTPPRRSWDHWSVVGMFDTLELEMKLSSNGTAGPGDAEPSAALRAEFDPQYGYPRKFHRLAFGASEGASDRDIRWEVTRFEPVAGK